MAESKVNRENYISLQGWMITDLKLKGNELIIYACIYGFSQAENQVFSGSLQYLADWTNSTKQGVLKCLKSLVEKGLIVKKDNIINGVKFCEYYATKLNTLCNKVEYPMQQSSTGGIKQSLPNIIGSDNTGDNKDDIDYCTEFETLWEMYPLKRGKQKSLKYYEKARKNGVTFEQIKQGIENYLKEIKSKKIKTEFIKHGSTWFYNECWNDEYITDGGANNGASANGDNGKTERPTWSGTWL